MKRRALLIGLLALFFAASCSSMSAQEEKKAEPMKEIVKEVKLVKPLKNSSSMVLREGVTLSPYEKGSVAAEVNGRLVKWYVEENQYVKKGAPVALLDSTDMKLQLEQAKANLGALKAQFAAAEKDYLRLKELFEKESVTRQQLDSAQGGYDALKSQIEATENGIALLKRMVNKATVRAPFSGVITKKKLPLGFFVIAGNPATSELAGIEKTDRLKVSMNISEKYYGEIEKGTDVEFFVPSLNKKVAAKVHSKGKSVNNMKQFNVIVEVDNGKHEIPAGLFAFATIKTSPRSRVIVPPMAVKNLGNSLGEVYTVNGGKVIAKQVYLGFPFENGMEIKGDVPEFVVKDVSSVRVGEMVETTVN